MTLCERFHLKPVLNALGTSTITGANVAPPEVVAAVCEALTVNVEIDELQKAASRVIAANTGAEAGCVTSSASSALAITSAAAMTGADLARIVRLPDTEGLRDEIILQLAHDVNFGARISQMVRISGARVITIGTANHADAFHLDGAITSRTAAVLYVASGAVHPEGHFIPLEKCVDTADAHHIPVIVDAAAASDIRPFVEAGARLVITSGHKAMGAPTSGLICGRKELVRACYLQNWGIGRAMKVGKEGIFGLMAALERWNQKDPQVELGRYRAIVAVLEKTLPIRPGASPHLVEIPAESARQVANRLREGDPPVWVHDGIEEEHAGRLVLDLRAIRPEQAGILAEQVRRAMEDRRAPREDVPYHDLYWSEERLLRWPD